MNEVQRRVTDFAVPARRVLVIDEDGAFAREIVGVLTAANYRVATATSVEAAQGVVEELFAELAATKTSAESVRDLAVIVKNADSSIVCLEATAYPSIEALLSAIGAATGGPGPHDAVLTSLDASFGAARLAEEHANLEAAHRDNEILLRAILDNATAVIYAKDRDGRYLFVNKKYEEIFGLTTEMIQGKLDHDIFPAESADVFRRHDLNVMHTGQPLEMEEIAPHADGPHYYLSVKFPLFDAKGAVRGVCGISTDITDHKLAAEHLRQAQRMEAIGHLTGGIAHDFNNLNAVILGNLELIQERLVDDKVINAMAERAISAAQRSALLTERLLTFSRQQVLQPQAIDVNALVCKATDFLRRSLGETIAIRTVLAGDAWPAFVDPAQLENAIINLAINSRDAMANGGVLTIETSNRLFDDYEAMQAGVRPGSYLQLSVRDTGCGIPPEIKDRIFEPYFTTKPIGRGSGLGLSIVYGFMSQSEGKVELESAPGQGTTVRLILPRAHERGMLAGTVIQRPADTHVARGETILVVEDEPEVRRIAIAFLEDLGYRVLQAPDAAAAMALVRVSPPIDLILADVVLPGGMSGRDLAAAVREHHPGTCVVLMSGYAREGAYNAELGEADPKLLDKPFTKAKLAEALREALAHSAAHLGHKTV